MDNDAMLMFDDNVCECNDTKCSSFDYTWDNDGNEEFVTFICGTLSAAPRIIKRKLCINGYRKLQIKKVISSKLLFRGSEHNFSAAEFHKRCDRIENTLVIAKKIPNIH